MIYLLLAIFLVVVYDRIRYKTSIFRQIPGPRSWPLIGNTWSFISTPDQLFPHLRYIHRTYGNFSQVHSINYHAVNLYNPEDLEKILSSTTYNEKRRPYTFIKSWLGEGLLTSNGEKWHQRRKLLTSAFHFNILKKYAMIFTEQTERFLAVIEDELDKDKTDIVPLITNATLHIMCETAMGTSITSTIKSVVNKYFQASNDYIYCVVQRMCRIWLYFDYVFIFTKMFWDQRRAVAELHKFTTKIIEERKASKQECIFTDLDDDVGMNKKGKLPMLDLLLEKEKKGEIDLRGVREEVDTFMFEGHDTTARALTFFIMSIANESRVQEKIYEEMENIFGDSDRSATMEDLNSMKYLECCIKESLRLYPSVPFIARNVPKDTVLSGYTIPANTICHIFVFDLHRRADIYPEPEKFVPERFLPENAHKRHPFAYLPFSAGPRNCIGQRFAMLEMKTMVSGLIRKYRLEAVTRAEDLVFTVDLVLRTNHPIYVKFHKRT